MPLSLPAATLGAGALSAVGGIASGRSSAKAAEKAAKLQIAWERERAQNAHQWEVADLKAAGLNPILSAGGQGAMTGGISAPVPDTSGYENASSSAITSALDAIRLSNENKTTKATVDNTEADTALKFQQKLSEAQRTINLMREEGLIDAKKQHEYAESLLTTGKTELIYIELKRQHATILEQIEMLKVQLEKEKADKDTAAAKATQAKIDAAWRKADKIIGYITDIGGTMAKGAGAAVGVLAL